MYAKILPIIICFLFPWSVLSQEQGIDHISLAGRLITEGRLKEAQTALEKVDSAERLTDKFITIRGLLHLYQKEFDAALMAFNKIESSKDRYIGIYRGQALFGLNLYQDALAAFDSVKDLADDIPSIQSIRGKSYWALGQYNEAWQVIKVAKKRFPSNRRFFKLQLSWLMERGLTEEALAIGLDLMQHSKTYNEDVLTIASGLAQAQSFDKAIVLLEALHIKNPEDTKILNHLAYSYLAKGMLNTSAGLFEKAAMLKPQFAFEAAEVHRRNGSYLKALNMNQKVLNQKKKFKQRFAILVASGSYSEAIATASSLTRLGLLDDDNLRYALGYSFFKEGAYNQASKHLSQVMDAQLIKKVNSLRHKMIQCQSSGICA